MIKIKRANTNDAVSCTMELCGEKIEVVLKPLAESERQKLYEPFQKRKQLMNPISKSMELVPYLDIDTAAFKTAADDLLDKVLVNFHGVGDENGPLDGTQRENKLLLGSLMVHDVEDLQVVDEAGQVTIIKQPRERMFRALIFDRAVELGKATAEVEAKN